MNNNKSKKRFKDTRKQIARNSDKILREYDRLVNADGRQYEGLLEKMVQHISYIRELSPRIQK